MCGEAYTARTKPLSDQGPSPRVRGSQRIRDGRGACRGSIPACAGKPFGPSMATGLLRVHPRVCGEAASLRRELAEAPGPSPRMRGSLNLFCSVTTFQGVHPRVCGEARCRRSCRRVLSGPSPPVRGSRIRSRGSIMALGSIPACAGKPRSGDSLGWRSPIGSIPACAGKPRRLSSDRLRPIAQGPSPRVRGSHRRRPAPPF